MDEWRVECGDAADDDVDGALVVVSLQPERLLVVNLTPLRGWADAEVRSTFGPIGFSAK